MGQGQTPRAPLCRGAWPADKAKGHGERARSEQLARADPVVQLIPVDVPGGVHRDPVDVLGPWRPRAVHDRANGHVYRLHMAADCYAPERTLLNQPRNLIRVAHDWRRRHVDAGVRRRTSNHFDTNNRIRRRPCAHGECGIRQWRRWHAAHGNKRGLGSRAAPWYKAKSLSPNGYGQP